MVFGIMLLFSLASYLLIKAYGRDVLKKDEETKIIVTSFYPVYIITENLAKGLDKVQVVNLTENQTGCLHDYQLTTKDMLMLENADVLIINGGNMELFMEGAAAGLPELPIIDSCSGMDFLMGEGHHHDETARHDEAVRYDEAVRQAGTIYQEENAEGESAEEGLAPNGHVWMDMNRYLMQIKTISDALCQIDSEHAEVYRQNEEEYWSKIEALQSEYEVALSGLAGMEVIIFHDAFYYLCDELGMEVVHGIDMDADSALSAGEIAEITDEIRLHGIRYLLAEGNADALDASLSDANAVGTASVLGTDMTEKIVEQIAKENGCQVIYLTALTSGEMDMDAYLEGMYRNMGALSRIEGQ